MHLALTNVEVWSKRMRQEAHKERVARMIMVDENSKMSN
jgi:hypothetical protein